MLDSEPLVAHVLTKSLSRDDIVGFFNNAMSSDVHSPSELVLVLAAYCKYISTEEILYLFPSFSCSNLKRILSALTRKGYITKEPLPESDGTVRQYYRITIKGVAEAGNIMQRPVPKLSRSNSRSMLHDYSAGYNLIGMLTLGIPLSWRREVSDVNAENSFRRNYKESGSLWMDAVCMLYPDDSSRYRLVYFEQDMLTERAPVLLGKLRDYYRLRLMGYASDIIVFSFRKSGVAVEPNSRYMKDQSFSASKCRMLYDLLERTWEPDAFQFLSYADINDDFKQYIVSFLKQVGAINIIKTDEGTEYERKGIVSRPEFVREYLETLENHTNPYMFRAINKTHAHYRQLRLSYAIQSVFENKDSLPDYTWPLLHGFQVLFLPTTLIANYMPYAMLSLFPMFQERLREALCGYFGELSFENELSSRMELSEGRFLRLRNIFSYIYGQECLSGSVSIEFPCMDLGSWLRVSMFAGHYSEGRPFNVICVFDNMEQAREFFDAVDYDYPSEAGPDRSGIFCMLISELERKDPLFIKDPGSPQGVRYLNAPYS